MVAGLAAPCLLCSHGERAVSGRLVNASARRSAAAAAGAEEEEEEEGEEGTATPTT